MMEKENDGKTTPHKNGVVIFWWIELWNKEALETRYNGIDQPII